MRFQIPYFSLYKKESGLKNYLIYKAFMVHQHKSNLCLNIFLNVMLGIWVTV